MEQNRRRYLKILMILVCVLFLVLVAQKDMEKHYPEPEGEKITAEDVKILLEAVGLDTSWIEEKAEGDSFTYGEYCILCESLKDVCSLPDYAQNYEKEQALLKEHWYEAYRVLLACYDTESSIWESAYFILKVDTKEHRVYTDNHAEGFQYASGEFERFSLCGVKAYGKGDTLLTITENLPTAYTLQNVWVEENEEGELQCFYRQVHFSVPLQDRGKYRQLPEREQIADLRFEKGALEESTVKGGKIHGKLLRVSEEEIEIEGEGTFPVAEGFAVYQVYGSLKALDREDMKIGYEDSDFVLDRGQICACLVSRKEDADLIRVLLKNPANGSVFYDEVILERDGEQVCVSAKDLEEGQRERFQSDVLTGKVGVCLENTQKEDFWYRGAIECCKTKEGMLLINELPLEEYLYAVVPSEMPSSYPEEALKAQAVCARTYAYRFILHAGYPQYGAHVDDTTAYQVYHNCSENVRSTNAVKDTLGLLLTYEGEPAENFYYSTSCGLGADAGIWMGGGDIPYLKAKSYQGEGREAPSMDEKTLKELFMTTCEEDWEHEEPWYRWSYQVQEESVNGLQEKLKQCYQKEPEKILTLQAGGYYASEPVGELGDILDITVDKRGEGGVVQELLIVGEKRTVKVISEYTIRTVLCDGSSEVVRQDQTTMVPRQLLPSGFFVIETGKSKGNVVRYTLTGGGYGHGVGMSQNGAKALGNRGASFQEILEIYFPGCVTENENDL